MPCLLIIEDQPDLLDSMRFGLEAEGFDVLTAQTGDEGYSACLKSQPDAVVLDLMLPDIDGLQLLTNLRHGGFSKPFLVVSARDTVDQRVTGLNSGADDYLTKPFVFSELLARVRSLLRRDYSSTDTLLKVDDIVLNLVTRRVTRGGAHVDLTPRQFDVLAYLLMHKNQVVSRESLARDIWRSDTATWTNLIEVQINRLRNKLDTPGQKLRLETIRGQGYLLGDRRA